MARATVRDASEADGAACAAVYAPYVTDTAISFESDPPSAEQMAQRIATVLRTHAWVVLDEGGHVAGYAYGQRHHTRPAYRWACEVSIYIEPGRRRTGAGRALYEALFARLAARGYRIAVAGMTLPNEASEALHRALGFQPVGVYRRIGYKLGAWHDVEWVQRPLMIGSHPPTDPPAEPR